jgi:hypothetical protein
MNWPPKSVLMPSPCVKWPFVTGSAIPHHHFSNKAALVRALVSEAFEQLTKASLESKRTQTESLAALKATGIAYVTFALASPTEF